ncbi:MAG: ribosome maturation factor RimP, partial [Clostridia bacterium]|nr:ribosome maturation factor RimP [Clostridia bacterium]
RVFIDKDEGISIDDCTEVSHAIDPIIDEADPIDKAYYLEVCSPGIEREITRPEHYNELIGVKIKLKLYKALDGVKEFIGVLKSAQDDIIIETEKGEFQFSKKDISKASVFYE